MHAPWRIELFGGVTLRQENRVIVRFQTAKSSSLLAYLTRQARPVPRESLIERLWPEAELEAARNRLRVALNSLRRQLEPPGVPSGAVLLATRAHVSLNPATYTSDVQDFEGALLDERQALDDEERIRCLERAAQLYRGELLAGLYDEWILTDRTALAESCLGALRRLTRLLAQAHRYEEALEYARRAVALDPLAEKAQRALIRLYGRTGRPAAAARQYRELSKILREELGTRPSAATRKLAKKYARGSGVVPKTPALPSSPTPAPLPTPAIPALPPATEGAGIPVQFTPLFGRQQVVQGLCDRLHPQSERTPGTFLTLTGAGGIGKSRVAAEVATRLRAAWEGRVWFVAWPEAQAEGELMEVLAQAMGLGLGPGGHLAERVLERLESGPSLLVLDDLDLSRAVEALRGLRQRIPTLACLATARRRLDVEGETELPLGPLDLPDPEAGLLDLAECPSVALFVERAQAVRPDFQLTLGNAATLRSLCLRLEGIPLALELAAAWAQVLSPAQMLERLGDRFGLLVSRRRTRQERHRSLRAAIDSTYDLLTPELQQLFQRLSVFRGGFRLESAEEVLDSGHTLEGLEQLRQHALVGVQESELGVRFFMLDSLQEYAAQRLSDNAPERWRQAHAEHFLSLAEAGRQGLEGLESEAWLARLEVEHDNLACALAFLVEQEQRQAALRMAAALWRFWFSGGHPVLGCRWLTRVLALERGQDPALRIAVLEGLGRLSASLGDLLTAQDRLQEALELARREDSGPLLQRALTNAALVATEEGDSGAASELYDELVACCRNQGDPWRLARALDAQGRALAALGQTEEASQVLCQALTARRAVGDRWGSADTLLTLGTLCPDEEEGWLAEGRSLFAMLEDSCGLGVTCLNIGSLAAEQGDLPVAAELMSAALENFRDLRDPWYQALCLESLGSVRLAQGDHSLARQALGEALSLRREVGDEGGLVRIKRRLAEVSY